MQKILKNVVLLSGRPASGKTQILIAYANSYPETTLFISNETTREQLTQRGLDKKIAYCTAFDKIDIAKFETICIDYLELFDKDAIMQFITKALESSIRVVVATQMKRNGATNNIFENISE